MQLESAFVKWGIPLEGSHFLVAFSGGLDSTVLVHSMVRLAGRYRLKLALGHVNHGLRDEAGREEAFCRETAERLNLPLAVERLDAGRRRGESVEAWARRERYAALEQMRRSLGARWVLTAHHADDQVETVLMRLAQRAPFLGLAGIRPQLGRVLRPLLACTRVELRAWAEKEGLAWVEDPSNADLRYLRNRFRHGLAASVAAEMPGARDSLLGLARLAQEYEARCASAAREVADLASEGAVPGTTEVPVEALLPVEDDIFRLAVATILRRCLGTAPRLSSPHWQNFRHFVRVGAVGKVFELPDSVRVLRDRGRLAFYRAEQAESPVPCPLKSGRTRWGFHDFRVIPETPAGADTGLWLRAWRSGDRASPIPGERMRLVSDMYTDARLSRLEKAHWPLVVTGKNDIVWVPGLDRPGAELQRTPWSIQWQTRIHRN